MNLKCFLYGNHPNNHVSDHHCEMKQLKNATLTSCQLRSKEESPTIRGNSKRAAHANLC